MDNKLDSSRSVFRTLKSILNGYFGKVEYAITVVNVAGSVKQYIFHTLEEINSLVSEINTDRYWGVQKIEKFRRFNFKFSNTVVHSPLHFQLENVTELRNCDNWEYSFLKQHESINKVEYVLSKVVEPLTP